MKLLLQTLRLCSAVILVAATFTSSSLLASEDATSMEGFKMLKVAPGLATANTLIKTILPFIDGHPDGGEGRQSLDITVRKVDGHFVVNIVKTGYADDSVKGEHYRGGVVRTSNGQWELITMGQQYLCHRSKNSNGICN